MIAVLCNHVQPLLAGDVQEIDLFGLFGDRKRACIDRVAVCRERLRFLRHMQQFAELAVCVAHRRDRRRDVYERDAGLFGQPVEVLHDRVLRFADVNDHLRAACEQRLKVQFALAAVKLTEFGQVIVGGIEELLRGFVPLGRDADQLVRAKREHDDLRKRSGDRDALDVDRKLHLASDGIGEHERFGHRFFGRLRLCRFPDRRFRRFCRFGRRCSRVFCWDGLRRGASDRADQHQACKQPCNLSFHFISSLFVIGRITGPPSV